MFGMNKRQIAGISYKFVAEDGTTPANVENFAINVNPPEAGTATVIGENTGSTIVVDFKPLIDGVGLLEMTADGHIGPEIITLTDNEAFYVGEDARGVSKEVVLRDA